MDPQTEEKKSLRDLLLPAKDKPAGQKEVSSVEQQVSGNPDDLEKDWARLQEEWKRYEERQRQYLQRLNSLESSNPVQESAEIGPSVEDLEKKLAEYSVKNKGFDAISQQDKVDSPIRLQNEPGPVAAPVQSKGDALSTPSAEAGLLDGKPVSGHVLGEVRNPSDLGRLRDLAMTEKQRLKRIVSSQGAASERQLPENADRLDVLLAVDAEPPVILKKKPSIMDKLRLLKNPAAVMLLEKIDDKKTLGQLTLEVNMTPEEAAKALDQLKRWGYV